MKTVAALLVFFHYVAFAMVQKNETRNIMLGIMFLAMCVYCVVEMYKTKK